MFYVTIEKNQMVSVNLGKLKYNVSHDTRY